MTKENAHTAFPKRLIFLSSGSFITLGASFLRVSIESLYEIINTTMILIQTIGGGVIMVYTDSIMRPQLVKKPMKTSISKAIEIANLYFSKQ